MGRCFTLKLSFFPNVCVSFVQRSISCIGSAPFAWLSRVNYSVSGVISSHSKMKRIVTNAARVEARQVARPAPSIGGQVRGNSSPDLGFNAIILCSIPRPPTFPRSTWPPSPIPHWQPCCRSFQEGRAASGFEGPSCVNVFSRRATGTGGSSFLIGRQHKPARVVLGSCRGQKNVSVSLKIWQS